MTSHMQYDVIGLQGLILNTCLQHLRVTVWVSCHNAIAQQLLHVNLYHK